MNKYIVIGLKGFLDLIGFYLIATWSRWFFQADVMLERLNVSHTSVFGLNMLKSDMGGFVLTIGVLTLLAVVAMDEFFKKHGGAQAKAM